MSRSSVENYAKCIDAVSKQPAVRVFLFDTTPVAATLFIDYRRDAAVPRARRDVEFEGVASSPNVVKQYWGPGNDSQVTIIKRKPNSDLRVTVNIANLPGSVFMKAPPALKETVYQWKYVGTGDCGKYDLACSDGPTPQQAACDRNSPGKVAICFLKNM